MLKDGILFFECSENRTVRVVWGRNSLTRQRGTVESSRGGFYAGKVAPRVRPILQRNKNMVPSRATGLCGSETRRRIHICVRKWYAPAQCLSCCCVSSLITVDRKIIWARGLRTHIEYYSLSHTKTLAIIAETRYQFLVRSWPWRNHAFK